jgi:hypothetical protein
MQKQKGAKPMKRLTISVSAEVNRRLRYHAADTGKSLSQLIEESLLATLPKEGGKQKD